MTAYQMLAWGLLVFLGVGSLTGSVAWVLTHRRSAVVLSATVAGFVSVVLASYLYYSTVLCPPGAGCV